MAAGRPPLRIVRDRARPAPPGGREPAGSSSTILPKEESDELETNPAHVRHHPRFARRGEPRQRRSSRVERPGDEDEGSLGSDSRAQRGLDIAPVPLDFKDRKRNLVGLGSYLVNAGGACADCHTCPTYEFGHNPYRDPDGKINARNYLAGGIHFGPFTSANLTPDASGKPAGLTREEFMRTIRTGRDHEHPDEILQVMP